MVMPEVTLESITNWRWEATSDHRGRIPVMPKDERTLWKILADTARPESDRRWYALDRKLRFRASRDRDRW